MPHINFRGRRFDRPYLRQAFGARFIKQNAETALWVFLSPLAGLWWAVGRNYPLFDPFYGGRRYLFGDEGRRTSERVKRSFDRIKAQAGEAGTAETAQTGSAEGEHAVPEGDAPKGSG